MNTCPVYRRSGGHSYNNTVPGPIGSILGPSQDAAKHSSLPHACSLCGSCTDVCPVKINLHEQLYVWRNKLALRGLLPASKRWSMKLAAKVLSNNWLYRAAGGLGRTALRWMPRFLVYNPWNGWGRQRELPVPPKQSFRKAFRRRD